MNISDQPQLFSMRHVFAGVQCLYQHAKVPRVPGDVSDADNADDDDRDDGGGDNDNDDDVNDDALGSRFR